MPAADNWWAIPISLPGSDDIADRPDKVEALVAQFETTPHPLPKPFASLSTDWEAIADGSYSDEWTPSKFTGTTCVGVTGTSTSPGNFYAALGIATSNMHDVTWPTYRANPTFNFVPLPQQNMNAGPGVSWTSFAIGGAVCIGNDCTTSPPSPLYGRYGDFRETGATARVG